MSMSITLTNVDPRTIHQQILQLEHIHRDLLAADSLHVMQKDIGVFLLLLC